MADQKGNESILNIIAIVALVVCLVGGIALITVGVVQMKSDVLDFASGITAEDGGASEVEQGPAYIIDYFMRLLKFLLIPLAGAVLMMVGLMAFRSLRKKAANQRKDKEASEALLQSMQWQMPPTRMPYDGPASLAIVDVPLAKEPAQSEGAWRCPTCGKEVREDYIVCPYCATALLWRSKEPVSPVEATPAPTAETRRCMYCGTILKIGEEECPECHHKYVKKK